VRAGYLLTDASVALAGKVVAVDEGKGMVLYSIQGPPRQLSFVDGLYAQDTWSRRRVTYTRAVCRGGMLDVLLQSDPALFMSPNVVVARVGGRVVGRARVWPTIAKVLRVPLRPEGGRCIVHFTVARTAIPKVVSRGQNPDPRALGMHFIHFQYAPP
jgi:hypothetical protein